MGQSIATLLAIEFRQFRRAHRKRNAVGERRVRDNKTLTLFHDLG